MQKLPAQCHGVRACAPLRRRRWSGPTAEVARALDPCGALGSVSRWIGRRISRRLVRQSHELRVGVVADLLRDGGRLARSQENLE